MHVLAVCTFAINGKVSSENQKAYNYHTKANGFLSKVVRGFFKGTEGCILLHSTQLRLIFQNEASAH